MEVSNLVFKRLSVESITTIENFIEKQIKTIPKDFFFPPSLAIIEKSLSPKKGISHGAFENEELIGIRLTYKPGLEKENHGYDLGYSESELLKVAQFHGTLVINDRRYNGIGNQLVKLNCREIFDSKFSSILATVHPKNLSSIKMLLNNDFIEKLSTKKYDDLPRLIFEKKYV